MVSALTAVAPCTAMPSPATSARRRGHGTLVTGPNSRTRRERRSDRPLSRVLPSRERSEAPQKRPDASSPDAGSRCLRSVSGAILCRRLTDITATGIRRTTIRPTSPVSAAVATRSRTGGWSSCRTRCPAWAQPHATRGAKDWHGCPRDGRGAVRRYQGGKALTPIRAAHYCKIAADRLSQLSLLAETAG